MSDSYNRRSRRGVKRRFAKSRISVRADCYDRGARPRARGWRSRSLGSVARGPKAAQDWLLTVHDYCYCLRECTPPPQQSPGVGPAISFALTTAQATTSSSAASITLYVSSYCCSSIVVWWLLFCWNLNVLSLLWLKKITLLNLNVTNLVIIILFHKFYQFKFVEKNQQNPIKVV